MDELNSFLNQGKCTGIEFKESLGRVPKYLYKTIVSRNIKETKCWLFRFKVLAWLPTILGVTIIYLKYW